MMELQVQSHAQSDLSAKTDAEWIGSEEVIPALKDKFYGYASRFSTERPLYFMMDCKANKARPTTASTRDIAEQLDLVFLFGKEVSVCSPDSRSSGELLGEVLYGSEVMSLNHTEIRLAKISDELFYDFQRRKDSSSIVDAFYDSEPNGLVGSLSAGMIISVRTNSNKYGLVRIKTITDSTCEVDACHVWL